MIGQIREQCGDDVRHALGRRFEQRGVVMKLFMNMVRNLTIRLSDANKMNEERWLFFNVY